MTELENAARAYITARYVLRGADPGGILDAICRVDMAWHELTIAAGDHDPECCGCEDPELGIELALEQDLPRGGGYGGSVDTEDPTLFDDLERYG